MVPGTIHEGGELGYALATAFGAVLDNPDLIAACIVGDGEAETGPTAGAWHSNKFLDPATCGAVLPILHVNGYKIANPTIYKTMTNAELTKLFEGFGWHPLIVEGEDLDAGMLDAVATAHDEIRELQTEARAGHAARAARVPDDHPALAQGLDGDQGARRHPQIEGTSKAHQVPAMQARTNPVHLAALEEWLASYRPAELFDASGAPTAEVLAACPTGRPADGREPAHHRRPRCACRSNLPDVAKHAVA